MESDLQKALRSTSNYGITDFGDSCNIPLFRAAQKLHDPAPQISILLVM